MEELLNSTASRIALTASGFFFMAGLLTGVWKYICMRRHPRAETPHYVNTAHRAALMYAFSAQLLAVFAAISAFSNLINIIAIIPPLLFLALQLPTMYSLAYPLTVITVCGTHQTKPRIILSSISWLYRRLAVFRCYSWGSYCVYLLE